jgi:hypothetical protein
MVKIENGMIIQDGLPPRPANKFYRFEEQVVDGIYEAIETGKYFKKYEVAIQMLNHENATQEDLHKVEADYIKRDLDILGQMYFQSYIPYPFYIAAMHNIISAWQVIRHNWDLKTNSENKTDDSQEVTETI